MSLSPECAKQHDHETTRIKTVLTLAAVGSVGIHGLAWAISAVLPVPVTAKENAPIELLLVSEPEEERVEPEDPLQLEEPARPLESDLENFKQLENTTKSSSDFLTAPAQLAPEPPAFPQPSISLPQELAVAPPSPEPTLLFEPEPESLDLEAAIAPAPEFSESAPLEPEPESQTEETVDVSEWEELETAEAITKDVEDPRQEESQAVVDTAKGPTRTLAADPEPTAVPEPNETKSLSVNPSLLDKIKDLRARARRDRLDQLTAAANRSTDRSTATAGRSATSTAGPNHPRTGQASASPAESRDLASAGHSESNPKPVAEAGSQQSRGDLMAAREPSSQNEEQRNRPARQTIACRRCSKPKFSKRELEGAEGETQFELVTDARGRVVEVIVTQSSGNAAVDEKTIRHIKKRWQFEPTSGGATVPVTVDMAVEGSDYYRARRASGQQEQLEYDTTAHPTTITDETTPTANKSQPVDVLAEPNAQSSADNFSPYSNSKTETEIEVFDSEAAYQPKPNTVLEPGYPSEAVDEALNYEPELADEPETVDEHPHYKPELADESETVDEHPHYEPELADELESESK